MAVDYDRGNFWNGLIAPVLLGYWCSNNADCMAHESQRLLVGVSIFSTETLLWCVTLVGFASIARTVSHCSRTMLTAVLATTIAIAALSASVQLMLVPWFARGAYLLRSTSLYSLHERQEADAVFARYRREGKPEEPVIGSAMLFRYAHDRNLFWLNRLHGRPAPIWILGDSADPYVPFRISSDTINGESGIRLEDYTLLDRRGRFVLFRKKE